MAKIKVPDFTQEGYTTPKAGYQAYLKWLRRKGGGPTRAGAELKPMSFKAFQVRFGWTQPPPKPQ